MQSCTKARNVHTHSLTLTHMLAHMHTHTRTSDSVKHWGTWALLRCTDPVLANSPAGRWGCTMPGVMVWAPEVLPGSYPFADMDNGLTFASPVITSYPCYRLTAR